jgi:hypothetical protein
LSARSEQHLHCPIAREGAPRLKEISDIHADAYPPGEIKRGPLALVTDSSFGESMDTGRSQPGLVRLQPASSCRWPLAASWHLTWPCSRRRRP